MREIANLHRMKTRSKTKTMNISSPRATSPNLGDDVLSSWVLDALQRIMGVGDIRNKILTWFIRNHDDVEFGKTFGMESTDTNIRKYLDKMVSHIPKKRWTIFTASNKAYQGETHYQTFVADHDNKRLWMIDPASFDGKEGIYSAYVAKLTIAPYLQKKGWKASFVKLTNPCQSTRDDVFCQTWSLWLVIRLMDLLLRNPNGSVMIIPVSPSLFVRYRALLRFFKECLRNVDGVCTELTTTYRDTIKTSPELVEGESTIRAKNNLIKQYLSFDPCECVQNMNEMDLMTEEQRAMSPVPSRTTTTTKRTLTKKF